MNNILEKILTQKRIEIALLNSAELKSATLDSPEPRNFLALMEEYSQGAPALIAELKRASPSKGILAQDLDLFQVAEIYRQNGAAAISVLTDEKFFLGKLETLKILRYTQLMPLPLLRKDFIIDETQIYEARINGADAILLIAAALEDDTLFARLHNSAMELGLTALVEVHNEQELERALRIDGIQVIGINNRNLDNFEVSLSTTERLRPLVPAGIKVIAESGIFNSEHRNRMTAARVDAILVGEALVTAPNIAEKVRELSGKNELLPRRHEVH